VTRGSIDVVCRFEENKELITIFTNNKQLEHGKTKCLKWCLAHALYLF